MTHPTKILLVEGQKAKVWFTPEPKNISRVRRDLSERECIDALNKYERDHAIWLASYKEIPIAEGEIFKLEFHVCHATSPGNVFLFSKCPIDITSFAKVERKIINADAFSWKVTEDDRVFFSPPTDVIEESQELDCKFTLSLFGNFMLINNLNPRSSNEVEDAIQAFYKSDYYLKRK